MTASLPGAVPSGIAAGLHVYVQLPDWCDEADLVEAAGGQGVLVEGACWHWSVPEDAAPALVLGYGAITEPSIRTALAILESLYQAQRRNYEGSGRPAEAQK